MVLFKVVPSIPNLDLDEIHLASGANPEVRAPFANGMFTFNHNLIADKPFIWEEEVQEELPERLVRLQERISDVRQVVFLVRPLGQGLEKRREGVTFNICTHFLPFSSSKGHFLNFGLGSSNTNGSSIIET